MKILSLRKEDNRVIPFAPSKSGETKVPDTYADTVPKQDEPSKIRHSTRMLTILFTDLVGSAAAKSELGIHKAQTIELEHKQLLLESLRMIKNIYQDNSAQTVRLEGDSYIFVFSKSYEAIHFALLAQRLHREARSGQWHELPQFRVGIHTGEVIVEDGLKGPSRPGGIGDIKGLQADTAARIMSLACGGQILCSYPAFDNARQSLIGVDIESIPDELVWKRHGFYLLKGREEPIEICEVGEKSFAPLKKPGGNEKAKRVRSIPGKLSWWVFISVILIMIASGIFWAYPKIVKSFSSETVKSLKPNEEAVESLRNKVIRLSGVHQAMNNWGPHAAAEVRENAPKLGQQLMNIADKDMDMKHTIMKYQSASFSLSMAACVEPNESEKITLANQTIDAGKTALVLIENVKNQASGGDKEAQKVYEWIASKQRKEFGHFNIALCYAIKARLGDQAAHEDVEKHLNSIPCSYQEKYPLKMEPDFNWYFENSPKKNSVKICSGGKN